MIKLGNPPRATHFQELEALLHNQALGKSSDRNIEQTLVVESKRKWNNSPLIHEPQNPQKPKLVLLEIVGTLPIDTTN